MTLVEQHKETAVTSEPVVTDDPMMALIAKAAADPNTDVDKMEKLFALKERHDLQMAERSFNSAMAACQKALSPVVRDANNGQTGSQYATLAAIDKATRKPITEHGFAPSFGQGTADREGDIRVTCKLSHTAGFSRDYFVDLPLDAAGIKGQKNKTDTHAVGSTLQYGHRYLKMLIFDLATMDDDGNRSTGVAKTITQKQQDDLRDLLEETGSDQAMFLQIGGFDDLSEIPINQFDGAVQTIRKGAKQREAAQ